jgi:ribonucleoside-diphosphate reductase alpha chain
MLSYALPTPYQQQIHQSKYARWRDDLGRRETWEETVDRFIDWTKSHLERRYNPLPEQDYNLLREYILRGDVLPSMRLLMTAGPAVERDATAAYNCSYIAVNRPEAFDEAMHILMCGTGVGFSVEADEVAQLPVVPEHLVASDEVVIVEDSKDGWAYALKKVVAALYDGRIPSYDTSFVRPAGSKLRTFGGRASGPEPLERLLDHVIEVFKHAAGRRLTPVEAHSIMCMVGEVVVVGGVRRSALISLSSPDDLVMRDSKSGEWYNDPTRRHFALANNSAAWDGRPDEATFWTEWKALQASGSGERGFFNRAAAVEKAALSGREAFKFGLNPCGEIILRDRQFCNLSQVTVRPEDTEGTLADKVRVAAIIGTIQSSITHFNYISEEWKKNSEEERLLGVGMTCVNDSALLNASADKAAVAALLDNLRDEVHATNEEYAELIGINPSKAMTCMKPAGNSTQFVGGHGSGLGVAHSKFYIRRNRSNKYDPVGNVLYMAGVPAEDDVMAPDTTRVFSYPMRAPDTAITRDDITAIQALEHWLVFAEHWCDHNPSVTINVREHEWDEVGQWVYDHFDKVIGVSFLPYSEHTYAQAPYEEITEAEYEALVAEMPSEIDWSLLSVYESDDMTEGSQELACVAGACEI